MNELLKDLKFYGHCSTLNIKEMTEYKEQFLREHTGGNIYKYVQFSEDGGLNNLKIVALQNQMLWFGCPWTMNDPTEFLIPKNEKDFVSSQELALFNFQTAHLYEMYNLCSFSKINSDYMWREYGQSGNGFCLCFKVKDFDWFYPVEYVNAKESYTSAYVNLWRESNNVVNKKPYKNLPNDILAFLPYVIKDRLNKGTGKLSEMEQEIRAIYCTYSEDNENGGFLWPGYKKWNNIKGNNVLWEQLKINLCEIIIGEKCQDENIKSLIDTAQKLKIRYTIRERGCRS